MLLIVTNRQDQTADFLILELKSRGADYIRFNTEDFPSKVFLSWRMIDGQTEGFLAFPKRRLLLSDIQSIWFRRPVLPVPGSDIWDAETNRFVVEEAQTALEGLWKTLRCFWVSSPDNIRRAENKLYQLKVAYQAGFTVWPTLVTNDPAYAGEFYQECQGDVVYKPLQRGRLVRGDKQTLIFTNLITKDDAVNFDAIKHAPSLLQKYIHKAAELRVTVIGDAVFAIQIDSQKNEDALHDWRRALQSSLLHRPFDLPNEIQDKCRQLVKALSLKFGALDLILTPEGEFVFVEINPNGQWAWIQQLLPGIPMRETLADLLLHDHSTEG